MSHSIIPSFEQDKNKLYLDHKSFLLATLELSEMVQQWEIEHNVKFTRIVGAPRGALELMSRMSQLMLLKGPDVIAVQSSAYDENNNRTPETYSRVPDPSTVKGEHCLLVDDVSDTGKGEKSIVDALQASGAASVTTLDWYYKPNKNMTGIAPDIYLEETDEWIVFPWEISEQYALALKKLNSEGANPEQRAELKLNFKKSQGLG